MYMSIVHCLGQQISPLKRNIDSTRHTRLPAVIDRVSASAGERHHDDAVLEAGQADGCRLRQQRHRPAVHVVRTLTQTQRLPLKKLATATVTRPMLRITALCHGPSCAHQLLANVLIMEGDYRQANVT